MTAARVPPRFRSLRIDVRAVDEADRTAWSELADRAAEPNPFFRPEFLLANVIERGISAELVVVSDSTRWLACLPVRLRPGTLQFPLASLAALTDEYSFLGTPLIDRELLESTSDAFLQAIRTQRDVGAVMIGQFDPDGPVGVALRQSAARQNIRLVELAAYERAAWIRSSEEHFPGPAFNRSDQRERMRRARLLATELGGEIEVIDRSSEPAAWEQFLAMENVAWKAERGTALGSTAKDAAFFRRMCAGMTAAGRFELVTLEVAGRTVAMECHLVDGAALYSFKIAYDPAFRRFSPGTQLKYLVIQRLQSQGYDIADSCAARENSHMNRLWPDRRTMQTLLISTGSPIGRLIRPIVGVRNTARRIRAEVRRWRTVTQTTRKRPRIGAPHRPTRGPEGRSG